MGVKSDRWVIERCHSAAMIEPFVESLVREEDGRAIISYGPSSYGYDIRCGTEFEIFTNINATVVDPKGIDDRAFVTVHVKPGEAVVIPPNSFALASSMEYLRIPRDVLVTANPKSTYIRAGVLVPSTVLEPEWSGTLTLELLNSTPLPALVYACEGICQLVFHGADFEMSDERSALMTSMRGGSAEGAVTLRREVCDVSYADRKGKYQGQTGITLPTA